MKKIRIANTVNGNVLVPLKEILKGISDGASLFWAILYLDAVGDVDENQSIVDIEKEIQQNPFISWDRITWLAKQHLDIIDITLIASTNCSFLHQYATSEEMYQSCDLVIELFDSSYWQIITHRDEEIEYFATQFKK
jgi:hypothetical protein